MRYKTNNPGTKINLKGYALCRRPLFISSQLPFGGLGAFILVPWGTILGAREHPGTILAPRDRSGGPWKQQDGHEVVRNRIFIDFGVILRPYFESFLGTEASNFQFVFGFVPRSFS